MINFEFQEEFVCNGSIYFVRKKINERIRCKRYRFKETANKIYFKIMKIKKCIISTFNEVNFIQKPPIN
jgi:hypothetical protein